MKARALVLLLLGSAPPVVAQPLLGSLWAREHPGVLPYQKCALSITRGYDEVTSIIGVTKREAPGGAALVCSSDWLGLSYSIPLVLDHKLAKGLNLSLLVSFNISMKPEVSELNGKTLAEVLGTYKGYQFGAGLLIAGAHRESYTNENNVSLKWSSFNQLTLFKFNKVKVTMDLQPSVSLQQCLDPQTLLGGDTHKPRVESDCIPQDPYSSTASLTPLHVDDLKNLVFQEITP